MRRPFRTCFLACLLPIVATAQTPTPPDLTAGGKPDRHHDWNLGPTGARGWIFGHDLETAAARQILVTKVEPGTPADGVLQVDDVLVGIGERPFDRDARRALGEAITAAEAGDGALLLRRWRRGEVATVRVPLPRLGAYADTAPFDCKKTAAIVSKAKAHLLAHEPGDDIPGQVAALALLATGDPDVLPLVQKLARRIGPRDLHLTPDRDLSAWSLGQAGVFLGEYYLATHDAEVLPAIREYAAVLATGQSRVGTWGHGLSLPQHQGGLGGYGAINQSGLTCWLALILAQKCGVDVPVVATAVERSRRFFAFYDGKGSVPYGDHAPYHFLHDNNGKNAEAAIAFDLLGEPGPVRFFARMSTASYGEREMGHTGNYFGYLWGPLGIARIGPAAVAAHLREQRWFYDLARRHDGSFVYQGGPGADDSYDGWDTTGAFLLTFCLPGQRLWITGRGTDPTKAMTGAELAATIAAGQGFSPAHLNDGMVGRPTAALLTDLASWSPTVRHRAGEALARGTDDVVPQLVAMLDGSDRDARLGACQALERLGPRGAAAVPALIRQLAVDDEWLQIRATYALCDIGQAARAAVPEVLRLALAGRPGDPRQTLRRYLGIGLFLGGFVDTGPRHGLLGGGLDGVDRQRLVAVIRAVLATDDGLVRAQVAAVFDRLRPEELDALWPDLLQAIAVPAPTGEMYASEIRVKGLQLLAKHHIEEGIDACVDYARTQNPWASEQRTPELMQLLQSYGSAAKRVVPRLRELAEYFRTESDFPPDLRTRKVAAVEATIAFLEQATTAPPLRRVTRDH